MTKVVVGMSGGVDSAVTAYLLKNLGYDVVGVTLKTWLSDGELSRCCELGDAQAAADVLGIPFYTVNCAAEFRKDVISPFVDDYKSGLTPNPCIVCNRAVKWAKMLEFADSVGAPYVATGHYAAVEQLQNGRFAVKTAEFSEKDQTYMLYRLSQEQLSRTIMPLAKLRKDEVRKIAERAGIPVANKPDSQEICFITHGTYADYIEENFDYEPTPGSFVDEIGNVLGTHSGIIHYTVGQRKGLGIAAGKPIYVKRIDADSNTVILSDDESLYSSEIRCRSLNFQSIPDVKEGQTIPARVKIRYRHAGEQAELSRTSDDELTIRFATPVRAPTPGQSAVFYDDSGFVIGGGVIV